MISDTFSLKMYVLTNRRMGIFLAQKIPIAHPLSRREIFCFSYFSGALSATCVRQRAEFSLYTPLQVLSTGNLHKRSRLKFPEFVTIDYCNRGVGMLYCYRQGERGHYRGQACWCFEPNVSKTSQKKSNKPLDKPQRMCYNKTVNKGSRTPQTEKEGRYHG